MRVMSSDHVSKEEFDNLKNKVDSKQNKLILLNLAINIINIVAIVILYLK